MNKWVVTELRKLGEFRNGANYPKGSYGRGDKIVNVKDLFRGRYVNYENLDELKSDALNNKTLYLVQHGDLLFTRSSLVKSGAGMVAMINAPKQDVLFCGFIIRFRPDLEKVNPLYFLYLLRSSSYRKLFTDGSVQTNISNINQETLGGIKIFLPTLKEQNNIVKIFDSIDTKIELNNRINHELEAMAKTLYDYWFVQFDFPNEQGKPYKSSGGKMVYNKDLKREIPVGWEVKELNKCVELIIDHRGKTPKKLGADWSEDMNDIIALSAKIVKGGKLVNLDQTNKVSRDLFNKWMPKKLQNGDILMTSEAPAGEFYFIYDFTEYCLSQRLFALRANQNLLIPSYFYYELSKGHGYSQIQGSLSGSTVFGIRQDVLRTIKVVVPNIKIQTNFNKIVLPQLRQIKQLDKQNQQLSELRDWLLPMLMNGQVTVKEAEEKLSMVAEPHFKSS